MKSTLVAVILAITSTAVAAPKKPLHKSTAGHKYLRIPEVAHPNKYDLDQVCIDFSSSEDWYYTLQPPWGESSGMMPAGTNNYCVPTNNTAGGAMLIGPEPTPNGMSTKFECYFGASSGAAEYTNCDISLVQGYSLSMACTTPDGTVNIGGTTNLFTDGTPCGTPSGVNCVNVAGPSATSGGQVSEFFQQAGPTYCSFFQCPDATDDPTFNINDPLSCTISGTGGASKKK